MIFEHVNGKDMVDRGNVTLDKHKQSCALEASNKIGSIIGIGRFGSPRVLPIFIRYKIYNLQCTSLVYRKRFDNHKEPNL